MFLPAGPTFATRSLHRALRASLPAGPRRRDILSAVLAAVLLAGPAAGGDLIPPGRVPDIETFMQIGYAGSPAVTPDGCTVLFTSNVSGVNQVYRLDRVDGWPYQLTVFAEGVDFFSLSPTGEYAVCGVGRGGNENAQLWLLDARTGQVEALTDAPEVRHENPVWFPDGTSIVYRSNEKRGDNQGRDFYVYRMDLATRRSILLADLAGWNGPEDVSADGSRVLVTHWDSNANSDMYLVNVADGSRRHLTPHDGEAVFYGGRFADDGSTLYFVTNANPDGVSRLARMDVASGEFAFLYPGDPWEVESVEISPDRRVLGWTVNEDGYTRLRLLDLASGEELPVPPVDGQVGGLTFPLGTRVVFSFSSATSTADVWLWDWTAPALVKLTHSTYAGIDPTLFRAPRLVRYRSFDGLEIPAFLYLPPGYRKGEPVPFVVHVHGGPESQFRPGFIRHFQYLLLNGYGILAPNVRGSTGYGKEYMDLDNYTNRLDSVRDLQAGAKWLIEQGYSAPGMLAVKGGSYGGYMTLAAITEYPDLFSAAVEQVGIANFVTFLEHTADYRRHLREAEYGPLSDREFLKSISPIHKADRIRTPLLVIHGENDPRVPVGEARQIAEAIRARGGEVDTLIFPDEGHGVRKRKNVLVVYRRMVEFLDRYLKKERGPRGE